MKKFMAVALVMMLAVALLTGCQEKAKETQKKTQNETSNTSGKTEGQDLLSGKHHVEIVVKDFGTMKLELDADTAPITVTNFVNLAKNGFYDGLTFHRIVTGFMIQGGDPQGTGMGGSEQTIKGEFAQNGVENQLSHKRGVISMARAQAPDSASSQFFIMHEDGPFLDGAYAAFGYVTEGIEIVDQICAETPVVNEMAAPEDQPVIETIKVID